MEIAQWAEWWRERGERELRRVVMREWDPLEVKDVPQAASEYDNYLGQIAKRLRADESAERIAAYLTEIETSGWESEADQAANARAAQEIKKWYADEMRRWV